MIVAVDIFHANIPYYFLNCRDEASAEATRLAEALKRATADVEACTANVEEAARCVLVRVARVQQTSYCSIGIHLICLSIFAANVLRYLFFLGEENSNRFVKTAPV